MKKIILTTSVAFSLVACNLSSKKKADLRYENLKGSVKSVTEIPFNAIEKDGEIQKEFLEGTFSYFTQYDKKGRELFSSEHIFDGVFIDSPIIVTDGEIIAFVYENGEEKLKYDSNHNCIEKNQYNSEGELIKKIIYKYDSKDNRTERVEYNSGGSLIKKIIYKYDSKDNRTEQVEYNSEKDLIKKIVYKCDNKDNLIEQAEYNSGGDLIKKIIYKYDSKDNLTEQVEYNSGGDLVKKLTYLYKEYDKQGNWIEHIRFTNGKPNEFRRRIISYY